MRKRKQIAAVVSLVMVLTSLGGPGTLAFAEENAAESTAVDIVAVEGGQVQGVESDVEGVQLFKGIPFAADTSEFMMDQIKKSPDPEATLKNFNSWALYHPPVEIDWEHTEFFSYTRSDFDTDTREEMLSILAKHFGLEEVK